MRKLSLVLLFSLTLSTLAFSQDYNTGIGVKFGGLNGFSLKHFVSSDAAVEVVAGTRWHGFQALVLYEVHARAFEVQGLNWYYGGGGHIGFWKGYRDSPFSRHANSFVGVGLDGVVGIEYKIEEIPITISLDFVPSLNIVENTWFEIDGGLALRYVF